MVKGREAGRLLVVWAEEVGATCREEGVEEAVQEAGGQARWLVVEVE